MFANTHLGVYTKLHFWALFNCLSGGVPQEQNSSVYMQRSSFIESCWMVRYLFTDMMKPCRERGTWITPKLYKLEVCVSSKAFGLRNQELTVTLFTARPASRIWAGSSTLISLHMLLKFLRWKGRSREDTEDWNACTSTSVLFCIEFFARVQSPRSIWKSQYLEVIRGSMK